MCFHNVAVLVVSRLEHVDHKHSGEIYFHLWTVLCANLVIASSDALWAHIAVHDVASWNSPVAGRLPLRWSSCSRGCFQKCKVITNVLAWIPVHNDERQQGQESRAKHSRVTCTIQRSPVTYCFNGNPLTNCMLELGLWPSGRVSAAL